MQTRRMLPAPSSLSLRPIAIWLPSSSAITLVKIHPHQAMPLGGGITTKYNSQKIYKPTHDQRQVFGFNMATRFDAPD
jgi:hypothetical protein